MNGILNLLSVGAAAIFGVGVIYWILDITVGKLKFTDSKFQWNGLQIRDFVFIGAAIVILFSLFGFIKPYNS